MDTTKRPVDTMKTDADGTISGTGTYMDGSTYFGPGDFQAERGESFQAFMARMEAEEAPEGEPATFFAQVKGAR